MRLITCTHDNRELLGAWIDGDTAVIDLARASEAKNGAPDPAFASMQALIEAGPSGLDRAREIVATASASAIPTSKCKLLSPLPRPTQLRDFLSFPEHVRGCRVTTGELTIAAAPDPVAKRAELEASGFFNVPKGYWDFPVYYIANRMAVFGDEDDIQWPPFSKFIDYELEWAAVIGTAGSAIKAADAHKHIFGYTIFNDWSARDEQMKAMGGPINLGPGVGKDFANSLGPCIVTADELKNPYDLEMKASVNGEVVSRGSTSAMHFKFDELIAYLTRGHAIYPGEVLGSGTVGSGCALETRRAVAPGDLIELEVQSIGRLRNRVVAPHIPASGGDSFDEALTASLQLAIKP